MYICAGTSMWHHHTASSEWIAFCLLQLSLVASVVILGTHLLGIYIIWEVIRVRGMWLHAIYGRPGVTHPPNAVHHVGRGRRFCMPDCSCTYLRGLVSTQLMTQSSCQSLVKHCGLGRKRAIGGLGYIYMAFSLQDFVLLPHCMCMIV